MVGHLQVGDRTFELGLSFVTYQDSRRGPGVWLPAPCLSDLVKEECLSEKIIVFGIYTNGGQQFCYGDLA